MEYGVNIACNSYGYVFENDAYESNGKLTGAIHNVVYFFNYDNGYQINAQNVFSHLAYL